MRIMKNKSIYYDIYSEFNNVNKYREMKNIVHHGNNRLSHINRVAKLSFLISKKLRLDYISCTRGAMMHDFFTMEDSSREEYKKIQLLKVHPSKALDNSLQYFDVNDIEKDIILSHMYPITRKRPECMEAKVVCFTDKIVSIYEFFRYQLKFSMNIGMIFIIRFMHI